MVGDDSVAQRYEAAVGQIQTVAELRSSIDDGSAAPQVALDAYTTAVDSLLDLDAALASGSGVPELNATLTDSLTLSRAKEARALRSARIAGIADRRRRSAPATTRRWPTSRPMRHGSSPASRSPRTAP